MKCFDDGREVELEDCKKCEFVICTHCGGCMLENMTEKEVKEEKEVISRRILGVSILKFLEEHKNLAFEKHDIAKHFGDMPTKEIMLSLYELVRLKKAEIYEKDDKFYYLVKE